ncbi:MAG: class I SAM-dependent methyltransferase [Planctomycetaceae bacterium]
MIERSPWLDIPLADYEGHMALPEVAQSRLLADVFERLLQTYSPQSVAVFGCAGGNGLERVDPAVTRRVVGVDLNREYISTAAARFQERLPGLQLIVGDIATDAVTFEPVELIYAALVLEYVHPPDVLARLPSLLAPAGQFCVVSQLSGSSLPDITPTPYTSLHRLSAIMHSVSPHELRSFAGQQGFSVIDEQIIGSAAGKQFQLQVFQ